MSGLDKQTERNSGESPQHFVRIEGQLQILSEMNLIKELEVVEQAGTPRDQLLFALEAVEKSILAGGDNFEVFSLRNAADIGICWLVFDRNRVFRKINVHMFVMDTKQPPFLQVYALRQIETFFVDYESTNREFSFTAFLTERSFGLYRRFRGDFFDSIVLLKDFYSTKSGPIDGYFGYRAPCSSKQL
jgi:hypothetical protein